MHSAQQAPSLHPKLARLKQQFRDLLVRPFDAETQVRLMKMEVESLFPGLNERDQERIVDIVLEHMEVDVPCQRRAALAKRSNVIPFPSTRRARRG